MDASASHRSGELPLPSKISSEPSTELEQMSRDLPETATTTMEWTNEKHSLYLESMEASFVNQLYDSMDLLGWHPQNDNLKDSGKSKHHLKTRCSPSGQFKVLREGCWKKLNFEKSDFRQSRAEDSFGFVTSPWIQHFRHPKVEEAESPSKNHKQQTNLDGNTATFPSPPTKLRQPPNNWLCREVVFGSNTEVSDQNFVDEDATEQKGQSNSSDQVVPCRDPSRRRGSAAK